MAALTFRRLRFWNFGIGLLQLVAGIAIFALSSPFESWSKLPWYTSFVASWSRDQGNAADFYMPLSKKVASFPIAIWSGVFLLLSAVDHFVVTLPGVNKLYNRFLCSNRNPFRWAEYSVSASLMSVMIAQLCGVTDIHLLFCIFCLMATTMLFGWQMEVSNGSRIPTFVYTEESRVPPAPVPPKDEPLPAAFITDSVYASGSSFGGSTAEQYPSGGRQRIDWAPFIMGCWPFTATMLVTACYFFQAVAKGDPPTFVWSLFFILFFLYAMFAVNQILQFKQVRGWRGFGQAEWWYMILSITSKQLLAWVTYGGTRRFENEGA